MSYRLSVDPQGVDAVAECPTQQPDWCKYDALPEQAEVDGRSLLDQCNDDAADDDSPVDDDNDGDVAGVCLDQDSLMIPSLGWIHSP
jgi:hypothetical protein